MKAEITKRWKAAPPGAVYPRWYEVGEKIDGELAELAVSIGNAIAVADEQPDGEVGTGDAGAGGDAGDKPPREARVIKQGEFPDEDGKVSRYARGATVIGTLAERMVEAGAAKWVDEK